ncbi:MAG: NADPH-dependent FMN reductase [bacterium]
MKLFAFAASLRKDSTNRKLLALAVEIAQAHDVQVDWADFREFEMPLYDDDLLEQKGFPEGTVKMADRIKAADGMILALPEYNFSIPGHFKNALDWVSRMRPIPFRGKNALLLAASSGAIGGIRGLWQSRIPLEGLGTFVYPDMYTLPHSREAFTEEGRFQDSAHQERLEKIVKAYLPVAEALKNVNRG